MEVVTILNSNAEEAMLPFLEQAQKYKDLDALAATEGRAVDEIPAHALLKRADSKASKQEEEKKLGESKSNASAAMLSVTDSSKSDTTLIKSLDLSDLLELMKKKLEEKPWK